VSAHRLLDFVNDRDVEEEGDMEEEEEWSISMTDDMVGGGRKEIG